MSSTLTKSISSPLSNSNHVNSFKSKGKSDYASKKVSVVSKSQFNPQCPVVILKRPSSESKLPTINIVCVDSNTKSNTNAHQAISNKVKTDEIERKLVPKSQLSKSPTLSSTVNTSKPNSSLKGKLALGAEPMSETRSFNKPRRHIRGKPRRNSVSTHNISNFNLSPEDHIHSSGSFSDDPFNSVNPLTPLNTIKGNSLYNSDNYAVFFNQDKKKQEALLLLESLLSKSAKGVLQTDKVKSSRASSTTREEKKKVMASHLLINLLKPSPGSSAKVSNQGSNKFYAGPQFKQVPNISSLPLPPAMINKA